MALGIQTKDQGLWDMRIYFSYLDGGKSTGVPESNGVCFPIDLFLVYPAG